MRPFGSQDVSIDASNMSRSELQRLMRMGTICKVCDRKFILRDSYRKYAGEITYYEREKEQLEE